MDYLLAALPIVVVIVLLALRVAPVWAALAAIASVVVLGGWFPMDLAETLAAVGGLWEVMLTIAVIMLAGIVITNIQNVSGAQRSLNDWLNSVVESPERSVLFYGLTVVPLMESLIGWGVGIVTGLPLLLGTGISKVKAIQIVLLGLMLCPWGSFAPAFILVSELSGFNIAAVGVSAALFNIPVMVVLGVAVVLVIGGVRVGARVWIEAAVVIFVMCVALLVTNAVITPVLGGVFASLAGALVLIGFARAGNRERRPLPRLALLGFLPYLVVLVGLIGANVAASFTADSVFMTVVTNPAVWLTVGLALAPFLVGMRRAQFGQAMSRSITTWAPVCAVTLLLIVFGTLLGVSGMSATLAEGAAHLGRVFVFTVPLIGFIAGFVTASNTAAAALLTEPLQAAALSVGVSPVQVLGMQTAVSGAAVMCAPARVVLAVETAEMIRPGEGARPTMIAALQPAFFANLVIVVLVTIAGGLYSFV